MDSRKQKLEGAGEHIWLHYATQFIAHGRTYTLEVSIPMPIGASAELREQLLNEADVGMNQLASHVEGRASQILQQAQPVQEAIPAPMPAARPLATQQRSSNKPNKPAPVPAATPAPQTATQAAVQPSPSTPPAQARETVEGTSAREVAVPPTRQTIGASMPSTMTIGEASGNLTIADFIKLIRDDMGLTSKQAMEMLNVRSLSGLNLRDALERLQHRIAQQSEDTNGTTPGTDVARPRTDDTASSGRHMTSVPAVSEGKSEKPVPSAKSTLPSATTVSAPAPASRSAPISGPPAASGPTNVTARPVVGEPDLENQTTKVSHLRPVYVFDEEINPDEEGALDEELADLEESRELTLPERDRAKNLIRRLRESRGATAATAARLQVLDNVIGDQVTKEELQELVAGIWGASSLRKLKVDQLEGLISWAKEDDFVNEVAAVLVLLEEENYARGNR
jgi:hypothetical protein